MNASRIRGALLVCAAAAVFAVPEARSASYFSTTYFGTASAGYRWEDGVLTNEATGASAPFAQKTQPGFVVTDQRRVNWPHVEALQGNTYQIPVSFGMRLVATNSSGTILGEMPAVYNGWNGSHFVAGSWPWESTTYGYTVPNADGSSSSYRMLLSPYEQYASKPILSEANTILVTPLTGGAWPSRAGSLLVDVATGTTTPVKDLIPAELLARLPYVTVKEFSNDGKLLVQLTKGSYNPPEEPGEYYLLTPTQETPVPEPSTLAIALAVGFAAAIQLRRRRGE